MTRNTHSGRGGSKEVKEFSQVEDFDRDIKVEKDASSTATPTPTPTLAGAFQVTGASTAAATAGEISGHRPPPPPPPAKQPLNSDLPTTTSTTTTTTTDRRTQPLQQHQYLPNSPRQYQTPYEPYYNNFVDDSSNRHIIIHNDDPERPSTITITGPPPRQRRLPPFSQRWHVIKRFLTLLSMTWSIVILALSCTFAVHGGLADGVGLWSLPINIAALLFNSAELLTYYVRRAASASAVRRGLHPGAHVGGHLCLWLACALAVYLTSSVYVDVMDTRRDCNAVAAAVAAADGAADVEVLLRGHCTSNYHFASNLGLYREGFYVPCLQTLLAMFVLATVTHFALFVRACVEVDRRNQLRFTNDAADTASDALPAYQPQPQPQHRSSRRSRRGPNAAGSFYDGMGNNNNEDRRSMPARNTTTTRPGRNYAPNMAQRQPARDFYDPAAPLPTVGARHNSYM